VESRASIARARKVRIDIITLPSLQAQGSRAHPVVVRPSPRWRSDIGQEETVLGEAAGARISPIACAAVEDANQVEREQFAPFRLDDPHFRSSATNSKCSRRAPADTGDSVNDGAVHRGPKARGECGHH
jgi:hypothetical protein